MIVTQKRTQKRILSNFRLLGGWLSDKHWAPKVRIFILNLYQLIILQFTNQPLHLSLAGIAAAALPSFILPHCLAYWTFLVNFGFFGLVSIFSLLSFPFSTQPCRSLFTLIHSRLPPGDRVPCGLHLPRPRLTPWSSCPFSCVWPGQLVSPAPPFNDDKHLSTL